MNKLILLLLFVLTACSTSVTIESTQCSKKMILFPKDFNKAKASSFTYSRAGFGNIELDLFKAFEDKGHHCSNIREVTYEIESRLTDVLLGLIPGFSSKTIKVYYR